MVSTDRNELRADRARDRSVESWLHEEVAAAYDAVKANPSRTVSVEHVRARLAAAHAKRTAKG
jgi:hypothetical protein